MPLPDSFLDELVARCDIYDVVSRYVPLKKSGANYFGVCPFHNEKTPSFSVSRDKQIYHCFGCGAGGGVINFIMRIENMTFPEAVRHLADLVGMEVPEESGRDQFRARRQRLTDLATDAARHYVAMLYGPQGQAGREYLLGRGLRPATLKHFGLGFAPEGWDGLIRAMTAKGYTKSELMECGLVVQNQSGGVYDRFRNRVMFPIIDIRGKVIAFGGRVMDDSTPKYLNSSDTPIFNKSRNLFAMNFAKKTKRNYFLLAEGYMDVIALHQAGFDCAVASLGTSLTEEQARLMAARGKEEVVICYDSDEAGKKAAQRAIDILGRSGLKVRVLRMNGAKDPDEYIRKNGPEAFENLLRRSYTDIEYRLADIRGRYDLEEAEGRVEYLQEAARYLATVPSEVEREIFGRTVAKEAGVSEQAMLAEVGRAVKSRYRRERAKEEKQALNPVQGAQPAQRQLRYSNVRSARCEEGVLTLALSDVDLLRQAAGQLQAEEFSSPCLAKAYALLLRRMEQGEETSLAHCLGALEPEEGELLAKIVANAVPAADPQRALRDYISVIKTEHLKQKNKDAGENDRDELLALAQRRLQQERERGGM
ncbi:MAG TPA: DNA primase [Firmicutes bacterium]|nr:DNA primase [Bacillota bacterium]